MTFNRLGIRNVCRRGSCVCPCSFYQTDRQPFRNWQGQTLICDEVARRRGRRRRGGHAGTVWSRYQIIVRPSGTQIGEQNCQIRKHVVMQQWNEIDRRQETEREGRRRTRTPLVLLLPVRQRSRVLQGEGGELPSRALSGLQILMPPNKTILQKYPVDAPCFV